MTSMVFMGLNTRVPNTKCEQTLRRSFFSPLIKKFNQRGIFVLPSFLSLTVFLISSVVRAACNYGYPFRQFLSSKLGLISTWKLAAVEQRNERPGRSYKLTDCVWDLRGFFTRGIQITELTTKLRLQLAGFTLTGAVCSDDAQIICHLTCGSMDKPKRIWKVTLLIAVLAALVCILSSAPGVWAQIQGLFSINTNLLWFVRPFRVVCNTPVPG